MTTAAGPFARITAAHDAIYPRLDPAAFVGRAWLLEEVGHLRGDTDRRQLVVVGEPGSGKSAFAAYLAETWNCPRHFIRADHAVGVIGVSPRAFLISVAAQLVQKYGRAVFDKASPGVTRVRAGLTTGRAEVVGRLIDELHTLSFLPPARRDVDVFVGAATGQSRVIGEHVGKLIDVTHALDELTLLHVALLEPLRRLGELHPAEKVVLVVDALDEARHHPGVRIPDVIPRPADAEFPQNLRLVMTSRPGDHLAAFPTTDLLSLKDRRLGYWQASRLDTLEYVERRWREGGLDEAAPPSVVEEKAQDKREYLRELVDRADGNFLYLHYFFPEVERFIRAGGTDLRRLGVPAGLDEIYRAFAVTRIRSRVKDSVHLSIRGQFPPALVEAWRDLEGVDEIGVEGAAVTVAAEDGERILARILKAAWQAGVEVDDESVRIRKGTGLGNWENKYVPLLGTLAVAYDALTREQLAAFARVELVFVDTIVSQLDQFLDAIPDGGAGRHRLYHSSFAEYLLDPARNRDFRLDGPTYHYQIASYYRGARPTWGDVGWAAVRDVYPFDFLAAHLAAAGRADELHQLTATGGRELAWAEAHASRTGTYLRYLQELDVCGSLEPGGSWEGVARTIRYSLIASTLKVLTGNVPPPLVVELVTAGEWDVSAALANVILITDEAERSDALAELAELIPERYRRTAVDVARQDTDPKRQARTAFALAPHVPDDLLLSAWGYGLGQFGFGLVLDHRRVNRNREKVVHQIIPQLARAVSERPPGARAAFLLDVLDPLLRLDDDGDRGLLLDAFAGGLPADVTPAAWEAVRARPGVEHGPKALGAFARHFDRQLLADALAHVRGWADEIARVAGLQALAPYLSGELVDEALAAAGSLVAPDTFAEALGALVRHHPGPTLGSSVWRSALRPAEARPLHLLLAEVCHLPPERQREVVHSALAVLRADPHPGSLTAVLYQNLDRLSETARELLIRASLGSADAVYSYLGHTPLPPPGGNAADTIRRLFDLRARHPDLHEALPTPERRAEVAAATERVVAAFDGMMAGLPTDLKAVVEDRAVRAGLDTFLVAAVLNGLSGHLPEPLRLEALTTVRRLATPFQRSVALLELAGALTGSLRDEVTQEALEAADRMTDPHEVRYVLVKLAAVAPAECAVPVILDTLRDLARDEEDLRGVGRVLTCAVELPMELRERALRELLVVAFRPQPREEPEEAAPSAPQRLTEKLVERWRSEGLLAAVFEGLSADRRDDFLRLVRGLGDRLRAETLVALAAALPPTWQAEAVEILRALPEPWDRTELLCELADHLPGELRAGAVAEALAAARQVTRVSGRSRVGLARQLARFLSDQTGAEDDRPRAEALTLVARRLPPEERTAVLHEALTAVREIDDGRLFWQLWCRLNEFLSPARQAEFFDRVRQDAGQNPDLWRTVVSLARGLPEPFLEEVVNAAGQLADAELAISILGRVARRLTGSARDRVVRAAFARFPDLEPDGGSELARATRELADLLPTSLQVELLTMSQAIPGEGPRSQLLRRLSAYLAPELVGAAVAAGMALENPINRNWALSRLTDHLEEPLRGSVSAAVAEIDEKEANVLGLQSLLGLLPEEYLPGEVEETWERVGEALRDPKVVSESTAWFLGAEGVEAYRAYRFGPRSKLLRDLATYSPLLALGGEPFIDEIFLATSDVKRWYP